MKHKHWTLQTNETWDVILWLFEEMHEQHVAVAEFTPLFYPELVWEQTFLLELHLFFFFFFSSYNPSSCKVNYRGS